MSAGTILTVATSIPPRLTRSSRGREVAEEYQNLCIRSWLECGFRVLSVNPQDEIDDLAARYPDITFVPSERDASRITGRKNPLIADIISALLASSASVAGIINSDIVFEPTDAWSREIPRIAEKNVIIGQRFETASLGQDLLRKYDGGFDYFFFDRRMVPRPREQDPLFVIGIPWWDYWFPLALYLNGCGIKTCERPAIIHLAHRAAWDPAMWQRYGVLFAKFVVANFELKDHLEPRFALIVESCKKVLEADKGDAAAGALDAQLTELGPLCTRALYAETVVLSDAAAADERAPPGGVSAARDAAGLSDLGPSNNEARLPRQLFAGFDRRLDAQKEMETAAALEQGGSVSEARLLYGSALEKAPGDAQLLYQAVRAALSLEEFSVVLASFWQNIEGSPLGHGIMNAIGVHLFAQSRSEEAVVAFQKALEINPTSAQTYYNLVRVLSQTGQHLEMFERFEDLLRENPGFAPALDLYDRLRSELGLEPKIL